MPIPGPVGPVGPQGPAGADGAAGVPGPTGAAGFDTYRSPISYRRLVGNDAPGSPSIPTALTVHKPLDWPAGYADWRFRRSGQTIQLGDVLDFERTDAVTFSAWVDSESFTHNGSSFALIFRRARSSDNRGWAWGTAPTTGLMRMHIGVGGSSNSLVIDTTASLPLRKLVHVVVTYTGAGTPASLNHYFDSVVQSKTTVTNGLSANIAGTGVSNISHQVGTWRGGIRHFSVWNAALNQAQIDELYNGGTPGDLLAHSAVANLRGWWKIEGDPDRTIGGGVLDSSGNALNGSALNGLGGKQWLIKPPSQRVSAGNVLGKEYTDAFTLNIWGTCTVASGHFLSKIDPSGVSPSARRGYRMFPTVAGTGFTFRISNNDVVVVNSLRVQTSASPQVVDGREHMLTVTYDGTGTAAGTLLYVDGVLAAKTTEAGSTNITATILNANNLVFGGTDVSSLGGGESVVRHPSVWGRVLTGAEVAELYNRGIPPDCTATSMAADLEGWWVVDEDDDPLTVGGIADRSGNGLDATALNGLSPEPPIVPNSLLTRDEDRWRFLLPGPADSRLTSLGLGIIPVYEGADLVAADFEDIPANSIVANLLPYAAPPQILTLPDNTIVSRVAGGPLEAVPAVNAHFSASAGIALSKLQTLQANSVLLNSDPTNPLAPVDFPIPANSVLGNVAGAMVAAPIVADQMANAILTLQKLAVQTTSPPYSGGGLFRVRLTFVAAAAGIADDVTIFNATVPVALRIVDVTLLVSTAIAASTIQLFSATLGGGTALSSALSSATTGTRRNNDTATKTCAASSSIFARRSNRGVAGTIIITCCRA